MTDKQKRFVSAYVLNQNASKAAREAGYPPQSAGVTGYRLLKNSKIQKAISAAVNNPAAIKPSAKVLAKNELTVSRLMAELEHLAFVDPADFFNNGEIRVVGDIPESARRAITGFKQGKFGPELRFDKKMEALTILAKHLGLLQEQPAMQQGLQININLTPPAQPSIEVVPTAVPSDDNDAETP